MENQIQRSFTTPTPQNPLFRQLLRVALLLLLQKILPKGLVRGLMWLIG